MAASIAAYLSSARDKGLAEVDVIRGRYVRPIRTAGPRQVTYRNERTLLIRPGSPHDLGVDQI